MKSLGLMGCGPEQYMGLELLGIRLDNDVVEESRAANIMEESLDKSMVELTMAENEIELTSRE